MLVLPLIYLLSVLNKLIGNICGGGKQVRTQGSMIRLEKIDFEANTQCFKYVMLSNYARLSGGKLGLSAPRLSGGELGLSATRVSGGKWD